MHNNISIPVYRSPKGRTLSNGASISPTFRNTPYEVEVSFRVDTININHRYIQDTYYSMCLVLDFRYYFDIIFQGKNNNSSIAVSNSGLFLDKYGRINRIEINIPKDRNISKELKQLNVLLERLVTKNTFMDNNKKYKIYASSAIADILNDISPELEAIIKNRNII